MQRMQLCFGFVLASTLLGCPSAAPPKIQFPKATDALAQLENNQSCGRGVQATAKIDYFGKQGRFRGELLLFAIRPASLRLDAMSPFGVGLATLTSDGKDFALLDMREKAFFTGPAEACNIARLTSVPIPGPALVDLLRGSAPILQHDSSTIQWSQKGYYVTELKSASGTELIKLGVHPDDMQKPLAEQRLRLMDVLVKIGGTVLYHAELEGHKPAEMSVPRVDEDGISPPIPTSGPECHAETPRIIHLEVPADDKDVIFRYDKVAWNPPIPAGAFNQPKPPGMPEVPVGCAR
jgi:hypothetical protein